VGTVYYGSKPNSGAWVCKEGQRGIHEGTISKKKKRVKDSRVQECLQGGYLTAREVEPQKKFEAVIRRVKDVCNEEHKNAKYIGMASWGACHNLRVGRKFKM